MEIVLVGMILFYLFFVVVVIVFLFLLFHFSNLQVAGKEVANYTFV